MIHVCYDNKRYHMIKIDQIELGSGRPNYKLVCTKNANLAE